MTPIVSEESDLKDEPAVDEALENQFGTWKESQWQLPQSITNPEDLEDID